MRRFILVLLVLLLAGSGSGGSFGLRTAYASAEVRLTKGATSIESNFPEALEGDNSFSGVPVADGYPTRAFNPLQGAMISVGAELITQAAAAFQATERMFDVRDVVRSTNAELKELFFHEGGYDFATATLGPL